MELNNNSQNTVENINPAIEESSKVGFDKFKFSPKLIEVLKNRFILAGLSSIFLFMMFYVADFFVLFALAPAILMAYLETPKKAIAPSLIVGLSSFLFMLWVVNAKTLYFLGVCLYGSILFIFLMSTCIISKKINPWIRSGIVSLIFTFLISLHVLLLGYQWFNFAIFLNIPLLPHYIGTYGTYLIMILFNASIAEYFLTKDKKSIIIIAIIFAIFLAFSATPYFEKTVEGKTKIALIQDKIESPLQKTDYWLEFEQKKNLTLLAAKENPSIIVWPEYSLEPSFGEEDLFFSEIKSLAKETNSYLIVGMRLYINGNITSPGYDSAVIAYPDGERMKIYNAMNPFPIKPYWLNTLSGEERMSLQTEFGKFNVIVCFDENADKNWKELVQDNPDFIIDVASNQILTWRGREIISKVVSFNVNKNRIQLFRSTSGGITAAYDSNGQIVKSLHDSKSGFLIVRTS